MSDLLFKCRSQEFSSFCVGLEIKVLDSLFDYPPGHRVDVESRDSASDTIGLKNWCSTTHEWVCDMPTREVIRPIEGFAQRSFRELGQKQTAKQCARPPGKPLVYRNSGTIVLLDLLFSQRQVSDEWYVEVLFYHVAALPIL